MRLGDVRPSDINISFEYGVAELKVTDVAELCNRLTEEVEANKPSVDISCGIEVTN